MVTKLRGGQWSQTETYRAQTGYIVLHNKRQVVLQLDLNLRAQVGALDKVAEGFQ